jgi:hypothetical protein
MLHAVGDAAALMVVQDCSDEHPAAGLASAEDGIKCMRGKSTSSAESRESELFVEVKENASGKKGCLCLAVSPREMIQRGVGWTDLFQVLLVVGLEKCMGRQRPSAPRFPILPSSRGAHAG